MILPDTSVWVGYLRPASEELTHELGAALEQREVLVCGPVLAELLAGALGGDRETLAATFGGLPWADLDRRGWQAVGMLAAELREAGERLPLTDLEIAVAARESGAVLWTSDRDFERIGGVLKGLDVRFA